MCKDLGIDFNCEVQTDASAAKGIVTRVGLGKVRHLETNQLWLQAKVGQPVQILRARLVSLCVFGSSK